MKKLYWITVSIVILYLSLYCPEILSQYCDVNSGQYDIYQSIIKDFYLESYEEIQKEAEDFQKRSHEKYINKALKDANLAAYKANIASINPGKPNNIAQRCIKLYFQLGLYFGFSLQSFFKETSDYDHVKYISQYRDIKCCVFAGKIEDYLVMDYFMQMEDNYLRSKQDCEIHICDKDNKIAKQVFGAKYIVEELKRKNQNRESDLYPDSKDFISTLFPEKIKKRCRLYNSNDATVCSNAILEQNLVQTIEDTFNKMTKSDSFNFKNFLSHEDHKKLAYSFDKSFKPRLAVIIEGNKYRKLQEDYLPCFYENLYKKRLTGQTLESRKQQIERLKKENPFDIAIDNSCKNSAGNKSIRQMLDERFGK